MAVEKKDVWRYRGNGLGRVPSLRRDEEMKIKAKTRRFVGGLRGNFSYKTQDLLQEIRGCRHTDKGGHRQTVRYTHSSLEKKTEEVANVLRIGRIEPAQLPEDLFQKA